MEDKLKAKLRNSFKISFIFQLFGILKPIKQQNKYTPFFAGTKDAAKI